VNFYRKSAGVLQDVLQEDPKEDFGVLIMEKMVGKWKWRMDEDVKGSRT